MPLVDINYLAVVLATLVTFALGALWYSSALFGPSPLHRLGQNAFVSILCHLVMALIVAVLMSLTGFGTASLGVLLGFLVWLGFAAPLALTGNVVSGKGIGAWFIDSGYQLVTLLVTGAILGAWRQLS